MEPTLHEVKTALEESNRLFEGQFKEINTKIATLEEAGKAVDPLLTDTREKLNTEMDRLGEINETFMAMQAKMNRLELSVASTEKAEQKAKRVTVFNRDAANLALESARAAPAPLTEEQYDAYVKAEEAYFRRNDRITAEERKDLEVGIDPQGGWLVTPDTSGRMVVRLFETSPMREYASVQTISTDALEGSTDRGEADFGWVGETAARPDTATPPVPAPWRIPVHEAYAQPRATQKMLEDPNVDVRQWLANKVGDKMGRGVNTTFVTGNGVAKPRGFASYATAATPDATRAWGTFEHIATGTAGGFGTEPNGVNKLLDLIHAMKDGYATAAAFYMNRTTLGALRQQRDSATDGRYVFIPSFVAGQPDQALGYPIRKLQDMPSYSTTDALAMAFGDMRETYQIVDRLGISVLVDPYTAKPYVRFYTRLRVGGDVLNFESLKFLKFGTS